MISGRPERVQQSDAPHVIDDVVLTSFVPSLGEGAAPAGSNYQDVYDRDNAINYIKDEVLYSYMTKTVENTE